MDLYSHRMNHIDRSALLEAAGVRILTGEACGYSMRLLCDVSQSALDKLKTFLGVCEITPAQDWNGKQAVGSVMLPNGLLFGDFCVFLALGDPAHRYIVQMDDGELYSVIDDDEYAEVVRVFDGHISRRWYRHGDAVSGGRNRHQMSGRAA